MLLARALLLLSPRRLHSTRSSFVLKPASHNYYIHMGKKKSSTPPEEILLLPTPPSPSSTHPIIDTHTHLVSTFSAYRQRYKEGKCTDVYQFVKTMYEGRNVEAIVDVWCEVSVQKMWRTIADSEPEAWSGMKYWFVMGVHPHEARLYTDEVENDILEAMSHPRCVGWGEIGLDYHYDLSPRDVQQAVFTRQLRHAVRLNKPLTIHTREAESDTERIMKDVVPKDYKIHVHCFTDSPEFAQRLLDYFPNLYIGVTGVITYSTNENTSNVIRNMVASNANAPLRILLETDAPYMVPANLYDSIKNIKGRLPVCHSAMVPWTAQFVAATAGGEWTADRVMSEARVNARNMYGV